MLTRVRGSGPCSRSSLLEFKKTSESRAHAESYDFSWGRVRSGGSTEKDAVAVVESYSMPN
jgi:hypothetical protein